MYTGSWHGPPVDTSTDARAEITEEERRLIPRTGVQISTRSRDGKGPQGESGRWQCGELLHDDPASLHKGSFVTLHFHFLPPIGMSYTEESGVMGDFTV